MFLKTENRFKIRFNNYNLRGDNNRKTLKNLKNHYFQKQAKIMDQQYCITCKSNQDLNVSFHPIGGKNELFGKPRMACSQCCFLEAGVGDMCSRGHSSPSYQDNCAVCLMLVFASATRGQRITLTVSKFLLSYWIPPHSLYNAMFLLDKMTFMNWQRMAQDNSSEENSSLVKL